MFVSAIDFTMPNNRQPDLESRESFEVVSLVYQKIRWTWMDGSILAEDVWDASPT